MERLNQLLELNTYLLEEMPQYKEQASYFETETEAQWQLFRSLVNVRPPKPVSKWFLEKQDKLLQEIQKEKGVTDAENLLPLFENIYLWKGDITALKADGIVNAANEQMTGCYCPCHGCIDNAIHTFAGVQLRLECWEIMKRQGYPEPEGQVKMTSAYNLPCRHVLHTVGPRVTEALTEEQCRQLASCYHSCLEAAADKGLKSLAFCCISTGEFHFPRKKAAEIAIEAVRDFQKGASDLKIVFNVFQEEDLVMYQKLLEKV